MFNGTGTNEWQIGDNMICKSSQHQHRKHLQVSFHANLFQHLLFLKDSKRFHVECHSANTFRHYSCGAFPLPLLCSVWLYLLFFPLFYSGQYLSSGSIFGTCSVEVPSEYN